MFYARSLPRARITAALFLRRHAMRDRQHRLAHRSFLASLLPLLICATAMAAQAEVPLGTQATQAEGANPLRSAGQLESSGKAGGTLKTATVKAAGIVLKWVRADKEANYRRIEPLVREAA